MAFVTFRRFFLDRMLDSISFHGRVLDIGGKKKNKRGSFRPPLRADVFWEYLNTDSSTLPDYNCSAEQIPVEDASYDFILIAESLEHIENPEKVLFECYRALKHKGSLIITIPFLYPVHADPHDYQRWTPEKIHNEIIKAGFRLDSIEPMGGLVSVCLDLILFSTKKTTILNRIARRLIKVFAGILIMFDNAIGADNRVTTGYFVRAKKMGFIAENGNR